ncbi:topoisomerase DNA-binding C4 zinc finger domain-containing protein [Rhodanobacter geophilus]|uniref:Topoisomerase DNA-binding C4 zinc finger domain-containing protein n=1 Tax=Rhodanobacter geophilus TaxID=3162488 RepID=A0ABV3QMY1_9GAMM
MSAPAEASPACPKCGKEMMQRTNRRTNDHFWGCTGYPSCHGTRQLEEGAL